MCGVCGFLRGGGGDDQDAKPKSSKALAWSCGAMEGLCFLGGFRGGCWCLLGMCFLLTKRGVVCVFAIQLCCVQLFGCYEEWCSCT